MGRERRLNNRGCCGMALAVVGLTEVVLAAVGLEVIGMAGGGFGVVGFGVIIQGPQRAEPGGEANIPEPRRQ